MAALLVLAAGAMAVTVEGRITGPVRVIDGDTLDVGGTRIRLHAVDAPEAAQTCETPQGTEWACGGWVTKVVADRLDGLRADCTKLDTDRYGRTVARCAVSGEDVGAWLVREGLAFAYVEYGRDYAALERVAEDRKKGLHASRVQRPNAYRAEQRQGQQRQAAQPQDCVIKGNIGRSGERIYHRPGQKYYDATRISRSRGERWFCSEGAAQAAGWRAARR
ncbi:thermonuclease family protein [Sulfitobacter sp. HNIBRBA3233]|uniref:thermonuclease family protein n=1 Tax=Sulfitobacter marinivivus TaxID=3158558 RepID=UPI0032DF028C